MALFSAGAWGFEVLSDQELSAVTAGNASTGYESMDALTSIPFHYSGKNGSVDGEVIVVPMTTYNQAAYLQLTDNAQSNLSSLININAVNSPIQILLNLNINVNSSIGSLNQVNSLLAN
jgi:hypothetical protein